MNFLKLLGRFIPIFKWRIIAYILLNVLASICSAFSFMAVIPLLNVLFGLSDTTFEYINLASVHSYSEWVDSLVNNVMYLLQEQITLHGPVRARILIGAFILTMSFLSNVISYFAYWVRIPIRTGISRDLRRDAYAKILNMKLPAFSNENRGDFVSRMTSDVEEIDFGIGSTLDMLIKDPVNVIVLIVAMSGISGKLTFFSLILATISAVIVFLLGKHMTTISLKAQALKGKILSAFEQTVGGLSTVKAFNAEKRFADRFSVVNNEARNTFNKSNRYYSIAWPSMDFFLTLALVLMLSIGGRLIFSGESSLQASELIGFLIIFFSIISPMRDMLKCTFGIRKAIASLNRLEKVSGIETEEDNGEQLAPVDNEPVLTFKNVSMSYEGRPILDDVSFYVEKQQKVTIIGNAGAGKTTIAKLATRFIDPSGGAIFLFGQDISTLKKSELRRQVCYIGQDTTLFNDSILNNITLLSDAISQEQVERVTKLLGIHDYIMGLPDQYETIIGDRGLKLSGGQKQCLCISRALLSNPSVIIFDESTAALDAETESIVQSAISSCQGDKTILMISHQKTNILSANKVVAISGGTVVEEGAPSELLTGGGYLESLSKLW